jgi:valyl-tRNA synthetase
METGYDILFFWVARMIMMGLAFTGKPPFHTVYLHGLIRDEHGRKMSKTYGNVIDPLVVMDELGTDALRFTLLVGSTPGNDMNLSIKKVEANRNFINKIWNAGRFVLSALEQAPKEASAPPQWTLADSWIWAKMQGLIRDVERLFQNFQYGEAGRLIYDFFWSEFADWYVEVSKLQLSEDGDRAYYTAQNLANLLDLSLRLLHPFIPFVTEELWQHLKQALGESKSLPDALIIAPFPQPRPEEDWEQQKIADFTLIQEVVRVIRNLRAEKQVPPAQKLAALLVAGDKAPVIREQQAAIAALARLDPERLVIAEEQIEKPEGHIALVAGKVEIFLPLADIVDREDEIQRLRKELEKTEEQIERLEKLLGSDFSQKAPPHVVEKERQRLSQFQESAKKIRQQLGI